MRIFILIFALMVPAGQRSPADPLQHLPPNIEVPTIYHTWERSRKLLIETQHTYKWLPSMQSIPTVLVP